MPRLFKAEAVRARYQARYIPAQQHYLASVRPLYRADAVIRNETLANPLLLFPGGM